MRAQATTFVAAAAIFRKWKNPFPGREEINGLRFAPRGVAGC
ncbi:hypothetical protein [Dokdonella ginsengisoli]|uniref:Uncharacterized protein n=1 Tax=Dokdonella ginsengisoli TaxID=363846 RepID=A0ABV9QS80_9GAMM